MRRHGTDTRKSKRKRDKYHSGADEWIDDNFNPPENKRNAEGYPGPKNMSAHPSERSTKSLSHKRCNNEDTNTSKKKRSDHKEHDTSANRDKSVSDTRSAEYWSSDLKKSSTNSRLAENTSYTKRKDEDKRRILDDKEYDTDMTENYVGDRTRTKDGSSDPKKLAAEEVCQDGSSDVRKSATGSRTAEKIDNKGKAEENCEGKRSRTNGQQHQPSATGDKSPNSTFTISDVERSLSFEGRVLNKRLKLHKIDDTKLRDMYDFDLPRKRKQYQPKNWKYDQNTFSERDCPEDRHAVHIAYQPGKYYQDRTDTIKQAYQPRNFPDRYVPERDDSEDEKNESVYTPKRLHHHSTGRSKRHHCHHQ